MVRNAASAGGSAGRPKVVLTDYPWPDFDIERSVIEGAGFELVTGPSEAAPAAEIDSLVAAADPVAILTCWAQVSAKAIAAPRDLRIVARMGVGLDNIDVAAATARDAWVTNVPDYCVEEVSDHALALILGWSRGVVALDREVKQGLWQPSSAKVQRLAALTVGLIGLGRIGRLTVRKLSGFGCRILASDPAVKEAPAGVELASIDKVCAESDIIVLHAPLLPSTTHIVNDAFIAKCRRKPLIVNVSRGPLIDNEALVRGLESGQIGAAALDVVEGEPSPPVALVGRSDVIVTPHIAFLSPVSLAELRRRSSEEVVRVLQGNHPHFPCNKPKTAEQALGGGVASDIHIVDTVRGKIVVKEALAELRVAAHWPSDPARSLIEAHALQTIANLLGEGAVPKVLWVDPEKHRFGMELIDPRLRNWKLDLLAGKIDIATASRAGELLGQLHGRSATRTDIAERFASRQFFDELRIRPYFERIAERNPEAAAAIKEAIADMGESAERALVHGDYSPKNILADGGDVVVLDAEVAHWGDPRFDLAFLLSHLFLKSMRRSADAKQFGEAAAAVLAGYRREGPGILDARLVRLTGMLVLARLEGDSPVDYLDGLDRTAVKRAALDMILNPASDPSSIFRIRETSL
jgi:D-3-phosphoglycerate dehydrogenase